MSSGFVGQIYRLELEKVQASLIAEQIDAQMRADSGFGFLAGVGAPSECSKTDFTVISPDSSAAVSANSRRVRINADCETPPFR